MAEPDNLMSLQDMGISGHEKPKTSLGGLPVVEQLTKVIEKVRTDRLGSSEYMGVVGFVENVGIAVQALTGQDTPSLEVREYKSWVGKRGKGEFQAGMEGLLTQEAEEQIKRMAGGNEHIEGAVRRLFAAHAKGESGKVAGLKERLGSVWTEADQAFRDMTKADKDKFKDYVDGASKTKREMFDSLWPMWREQDRLDLARRTQHYVVSSDEARYIKPDGTPGDLRMPAREGGFLRRLGAGLKGLPRDLGERGNALTGGITTARGEAIEAGLSKLKYEALEQTELGSTARMEMYVRGIITRDELGTIDATLFKQNLDTLEKEVKIRGKESPLTTMEGEGLEAESLRSKTAKSRIDTALLNRIRRVKEGKEPPKRTDKGEARFYAEYFAGKELEARRNFATAKAEWRKYHFVPALLPKPLLALAAEITRASGDMNLEIAFAEGVDGSLKVVGESIDTVMADWAISRMADAAVGREVAAKNFVEATGEDKDKAAGVLRGAEAVWQRLAMVAGRTADTLDFSDMSPAALHVPGALGREAIDLAFGGVWVGKRTGKILESLAERNGSLMSAGELFAAEKGKVATEEYRQGREHVETLVQEIFASIPEHFKSWEKMNKWMNERILSFQITQGDIAELKGTLKGVLEELPLINKLVSRDTGVRGRIKDQDRVVLGFGLKYRKAVLDAMGFAIDPDTGGLSKLALTRQVGQVINAGSARRTQREVLGEEAHGGGVIERQGNATNLREQMIITKGQLARDAKTMGTENVDLAARYDLTLRMATLTKVERLQRKHLEMQARRMRRRYKLDETWETVPKLAVASVATLGFAKLLDFFSAHHQQVAKDLGTELGVERVILDNSTQALEAAQDPTSFANPVFDATHQTWAIQAGQEVVAESAAKVGELSSEIAERNSKALSLLGGSLLSSMTSLWLTVKAGGKLVKNATMPFRSGRGKLTGLMEEKLNVT